jgi:hypothetical protein
MKQTHLQQAKDELKRFVRSTGELLNLKALTPVLRALDLIDAHKRSRGRR